MNIMERCKKASKLDARVLTKSRVFTSEDMVSTSVPMINVALSGSLTGGLIPGLTVLAGPSKHFKTSFALLMAGAYLKAKPDSIMLFYDSEFGSPQSYFKNFGIDTDRVLHIPITNAEEFKFDVVGQLKDQITKDDDVIIVVDSIGNLASLKETEDALNEKSVADMSRAKAFKSVFRMVTPMLKQKEVPMLAINHTYKEIGLYPKDVVSGGCVVEGTKILTKRGLVEIQTVRDDDVVITQHGDKDVKVVWNPDTLEDGNPECYEIEFDDGSAVTCSANHKFLVDSEWIAAKDLVVDMDCKTI